MPWMSHLSLGKLLSEPMQLGTCYLACLGHTSPAASYCKNCVLLSPPWEIKLELQLLDQGHNLMLYQKQHRQTQRLGGGQLEDHPYPLMWACSQQQHQANPLLGFHQRCHLQPRTLLASRQGLAGWKNISHSQQIHSLHQLHFP